MHEGNNIVDFGNTLRATLKNVQTTLPPDVKLDLVADQPKVVPSASATSSANSALPLSQSSW